MPIALHLRVSIRPYDLAVLGATLVSLIELDDDVLIMRTCARYSYSSSSTRTKALRGMT